jgi:hypothetical protein
MLSPSLLELMSENHDIRARHRNANLEVGDEDRRGTGVAVHVKPQCLIGGAEDEEVVAVLGHIVGPRCKIRASDATGRQAAKGTAAEAEAVIRGGEVGDDVAALALRVVLEAVDPRATGQRVDARSPASRSLPSEALIVSAPLRTPRTINESRFLRAAV